MFASLPTTLYNPIKMVAQLFLHMGNQNIHERESSVVKKLIKRWFVMREKLTIWHHVIITTCYNFFTENLKHW
jgi:hypothetical protein